MDKFDNTGLMAFICHCDIPLFFANINTPGEQQKYSIALLVHFFSLIPTHVTVGALYDVGCVLNRSLHLVCAFPLQIHKDTDSSQYDFLPSSIIKHLMFATSAIHAYGHQWSCQLIYNPRLHVGFGLTDGEGVERLWSHHQEIEAGLTMVYITLTELQIIKYLKFWQTT
jgi:hypothetical protein